jgi:hypothetical protein
MAPTMSPRALRVNIGCLQVGPGQMSRGSKRAGDRGTSAWPAVPALRQGRSRDGPAIARSGPRRRPARDRSAARPASLLTPGGQPGDDHTVGGDRDRPARQRGVIDGGSDESVAHGSSAPSRAWGLSSHGRPRYGRGRLTTSPVERNFAVRDSCRRSSAIRAGGSSARRIRGRACVATLGWLCRRRPWRIGYVGPGRARGGWSTWRSRRLRLPVRCHSWITAASGP